MEEDKYTRITLRIPKDLHAKLTEASENTSKSMNAEIIARLQSTFFESQGGLISPLSEAIRKAEEIRLKMSALVDALEAKINEKKPK